MATISSSQVVALPSDKIRTILPQPINSLFYALFLIPFAAVFPLYYLSMDADKRDNPAYYTAVQSLPGLGSNLLISIVVAPLYFVLFLAEIAAVSVPALLYQFNGLINITPLELIIIGITSAIPTLLGGLLVIGGNLNLWSSGTDLRNRLLLTTIPALVFGGAIAFGFPQQGGMVGIAIGLMIFYSGLATNGYIVKTDETLESQTAQSSKQNFSDIYVDPDQGEEVADKNGAEMVETLETEQWDAPDGLYTQATILSTDAFEPLRVITRFLQVDDTKRAKEVPKPAFAEKKRDLRTDISNIDNNAPDGFSNETHRYLLPQSVDAHQCTTCHGEGHTTCPDCRGQGRQQCGRCDGQQVETCQKCGTAGTLRCGECGGSGERTCSSCNGSQVVRKSVTCGVCDGSGQTERGFECQNCGGHGSIKKDRPCSTCSGGSVSCSECRGTGSVRCFNCQGDAGSPCKKCGGTGAVDCRTCSTKGRVTCEACAGSGTRVAYEVLERAYNVIEKTNYKTKSIPKQLISKADGEVEDIKTTEDVDKEAIHRKQVEVQSIPVVATIYRYKGNLWEAFRVNDTLKTVDYPRDFESQFGVVCGLALLILTVFVVSYGVLFIEPSVFL